VNFNDLNWEEPLEGVKCKIFNHGDKQLRLVVYSKEMPLHWCEKGHYEPVSTTLRYVILQE